MKVLFDQRNSTEVWKIIDRLMPKSTAEIATAVDISPSAISEWRSGRRNVTFERIPALAQLYDVESEVFLYPAPEVMEALRPHFEAIDNNRAEELRRALDDMGRSTSDQ